MFSEQPMEQRPWVVPSYYPRHVETHILMKNLRSYGLFRYSINTFVTHFGQWEIYEIFSLIFSFRGCQLSQYGTV